MNNLNRIFVVAAFGASSLMADVTYTEQVHYNGGTLIDMMKNMSKGPMGQMMQGRGGQAFQDQSYTVYVKGNKQARVGTNNTTIIDLDAGTITTINSDRKTYNTRTFEEIKQQMAAMQQRMGGETQAMDFDAKVKKTGKTKDIGGQTASEAIMTMTAKNATDGNGMKIVSDIWTVPEEPGVSEIKAFQKKAAEKSADTLGGGPMMGGIGRATSALRKELSGVDGVPVETKTDISGASAGGPMAAMMGGEAADPNAVALSMTTTNSNYKAGPVDDAVFAIPAGFKKSEPRQFGGRPPQEPPQ